MQKATFGAGCFWGIEEAFRNLEGVTSTRVGYGGGSYENPTYEDVCTGTTGHAEVVEVEFDPSRISYEQLLDAFWAIHDPTTRNRQGPDVGTQYRSVIFVHGSEQERAARVSKERLQRNGVHGDKEIVTEIEPAGPFWEAESYHQQYLAKRGQASCRTP